MFAIFTPPPPPLSIAQLVGLRIKDGGHNFWPLALQARNSFVGLNIGQEVQENT